MSNVPRALAEVGPARITHTSADRVCLKRLGEITGAEVGRCKASDFLSRLKIGGMKRDEDIM